MLCSEVLEHTPDPGTVHPRHRRGAGPGGVLILSTPQAFSTAELIGRIAFRPGVLQLARLIYREPVLPTGHISLLTRPTVRALLEESGFEITAGSVSTFYLPGIAEFGGERRHALAAVAGRAPAAEQGIGSPLDPALDGDPEGGRLNPSETTPRS